MSNLGLELALQDLDIPIARAKVGDRYVMEQLDQRGWLLGGESSGHLSVWIAPPPVTAPWRRCRCWMRCAARACPCARR